MSANVYVIAGFYALLATALYGLGRATELALGIRQRTPQRATARIWLGYCATILVLEVVHFFRPITWRESSVLLGVGLAAFIYFAVRSRMSLRLTPSTAVVWLALLGSAVWLSGRPAAQSLLYDSGLYHFQIIRWTNEYPTILGLGNLHGRLAYNHSFHSYVAFLNLYPRFNGGHLIANSFFLLVLIAECLWAVRRITRRLLRGRAGFSPTDLMLSLLLFVCLKIVLSPSLPGTTPDITLYILEIVAFCVFVRLYRARSSWRSGRDLLAYLVVLAALLVTTKLSALVFSGALVALACWALGLPRRKPLRTSWPIPAIGFAGVLLVAHFLTGVALSGYPLFPSQWFAVSADWQVPAGLVASERNWIYSWARSPESKPEIVLASSDWFRPWVSARYSERTLPIAIGLLLSGIVVSLLNPLGRRRRLRFGIYPAWNVMMIPLYVAIVFWFITAPDLRFLGSLHILAGLLPLSLALLTLSPHLRKASMVFVLAGSTIFVVGYVTLQYDRYFSGFTFEAAPLPEVVTETRRTESGLTIRVPSKGNQCWAAALPCTPYFRKDLQLRGTYLGSGFRLANPQRHRDFHEQDAQ